MKGDEERRCMVLIQVGCLHNGVEGLNHTRVPSVSDRLWPIIVCVLGAFTPNSGLSYILEREPC